MPGCQVQYQSNDECHNSWLSSASEMLSIECSDAKIEWSSAKCRVLRFLNLSGNSTLSRPMSDVIFLNRFISSGGTLKLCWKSISQDIVTRSYTQSSTDYSRWTRFMLKCYHERRSYRPNCRAKIRRRWGTKVDGELVSFLFPSSTQGRSHLILTPSHGSHVHNMYSCDSIPLNFECRTKVPNTLESISIYFSFTFLTIPYINKKKWEYLAVESHIGQEDFILWTSLMKIYLFIGWLVDRMSLNCSIVCAIIYIFHLELSPIEFNSYSCVRFLSWTHLIL